MIHHRDAGLLAAAPQNTEGTDGEATKTTLPVTEALKVILRDLFFDSEGCATPKDRQYAYDASRGNLQTIDVARVAMMVRRCKRTASSRVAWKLHLAAMVDPYVPALPVDRAALRKAKEVGEADVATEKYRVSRCRVTASAARRENHEAMAALAEMNRAIDADAALLTS
jgi:hypothetical protein